ncbi:hypothetical protein BCR43DRAFT_485125 [Syncephalastrum racemosum]|uniref:Invertebrate defensins family profile domain-containing protein n=1 Tax=Syncephalastrum racemosum TaxID=13706 RepID=A0A1X2HM00_SYNRA|nr:hypothetical protein BCR43DRAFT_485125 [Syncephalastrum racemosum]
MKSFLSLMLVCAFFALLAVAAPATAAPASVSVAPSSGAVRQLKCHKDTDPHANSVCKHLCSQVDSGYILGVCGKDGICQCKKSSH